MKRPLLLLPLLALALPALAQDPATNAEGAFFLAALERAREIAAKAGAECHVRTLYSAMRGADFERGTQLAAQLTIPNPSADADKPWLSKATATLFLGPVGTNGVDLADYDDEIRYGELRKKADANGIVPTGKGTQQQLSLRPTILKKCLHWTDGTVYAILQYPVRFEAGLFADLWRETTNAVSGRALTAPSSVAHPGDLEEEGVRLLPVLTERFAEAGPATILACWFDSRTPLHDGRVLHFGGAIPSNSKNPEWWMRLLSGPSDPADGSKGIAGDLFYGRIGAHPFSRDDYRDGNEKEDLVRSWTDGTRYLVLVPTSARHENPVWDRLFATATNAVAREIGE